MLSLATPCHATFTAFHSAEERNRHESDMPMLKQSLQCEAEYHKGVH